MLHHDALWCPPTSPVRCVLFLFIALNAADYEAVKKSERREAGHLHISDVAYRQTARKKKRCNKIWPRIGLHSAPTRERAGRTFWMWLQFKCIFKSINRMQFVHDKTSHCAAACSAFCLVYDLLSRVWSIKPGTSACVSGRLDSRLS